MSLDDLLLKLCIACGLFSFGSITLLGIIAWHEGWVQIGPGMEFKENVKKKNNFRLKKSSKNNRSK